MENGFPSWEANLKANYDIDTLVDVIGAPIDTDFGDQADMCEIVRSLIAAGKISAIGPNVNNIPVDAVDDIKCVGEEG